MKVNLFQMMQKKCNLENLKNIFYYYSYKNMILKKLQIFLITT